MSEEMIKILTPVIVTVITGLVSWGLAELAAFVRVKTKNENALAAVDSISKAVKNVVSEVGQEVKAAAVDGKFTPEERAAMKLLAIEKVNAQVSHVVQKNATRFVGDLDAFIASRIEREVAKAKKS